MKRIFQIRETIRKIRKELIIATILYAASFVVGSYIANGQGIFVLELRLGFSNAFGWLHRPFYTISTGIFQSIFPWSKKSLGSLPSQLPSPSQEYFAFLVLVLVLFAFGLLYTFAATILLGLVPLVGAILVGFVAVVDGVGFGERCSGLLPWLTIPPIQLDAFLSGFTPVLLTLVAEILSSSAGIHLAFLPFRAKRGSWWPSFKDALRGALNIFAVAIMLLAMASAVEIVAGLPFFGSS